jgi:glutamine amidotransferase
MIAIVDCGLGNVASVVNMLKRSGHASQLSADPEVLALADKVILPGVGAFDTGMRALRERGLVEVLEREVRDRGKPILGICLGMQMLTVGSEEGTMPGLGWVDARVVRFPGGEGRPRIPHMGWNTIQPRKASPLLASLPEDHRFYFVHSFHAAGVRPEDVLATTQYGHEFCSAFEVGNVAGVQFHPEKSHRFGLALLKAFAES